MDLQNAKNNLPKYHDYFNSQLKFFRKFFKTKTYSFNKKQKNFNDFGILSYESDKFVGDFTNKRFHWAKRSSDIDSSY